MRTLSQNFKLNAICRRTIQDAQTVHSQQPEERRVVADEPCGGSGRARRAPVTEERGWRRCARWVIISEAVQDVQRVEAVRSRTDQPALADSVHLEDAAVNNMRA